MGCRRRGGVCAPEGEFGCDHFGWLTLNNCEISEAVQRELPKLRAANPNRRPSWDASTDHDWEARGGSVSVDTDASKIIDAPLAEVASLAAANTTHPLGEFVEYRPFDGLVKERPLRALSVLALEARGNRYPTRLWRSALGDWPDDSSDRLRCLFAHRLVRLPREAIFDLRYYMLRWFKTTFARSRPSRWWKLGWSLRWPLVMRPRVGVCWARRRAGAV